MSSPSTHSSSTEIHRHPGPDTAPTFSQIMYPSHEARTRLQSPDFPREPSSVQETEVVVEWVCKGMGITHALYEYLMEAYFANMTSFTLFSPQMVGDMIRNIPSAVEAEALVAAMFSFSARFHASYRVSNRPSSCPTASHFAQLASSRLRRALDVRGDDVAPLWLLQSLILVTFYQLTQSVRSKSWRAVGKCVRIAYDMNLHLLDAGQGGEAEHQRPEQGGDDVAKWSHQEERRRAWWAIWEMDVFASTIRRSPMAIDWSQNFTFLPVSDTCWFNNVRQESCFLFQEPSQRWAGLVKSGNTSARAWFIVINSLMRNVGLMVYNSGAFPAVVLESRTREIDDKLTAIGNCLFCTISSLPTELVYRGESLDFDTMASADDLSSHQAHADKYAIHVMTQLVRFMIHHHRICAQAPWQNNASPGGSRGEDGANTSFDDTDCNQRSLSSWSNYMNAAQEIVTIVRTSEREHYKYVNPFLVNAIWFAAAAQIACRVFRPPSFSMQLISTNYDVLALVIDHFIAFWNSLDGLKSRLSRIEVALKRLLAECTGQAVRNPIDAMTRQSAIVTADESRTDMMGNTASGGMHDLATAAALYQNLPDSAIDMNNSAGMMSAELNTQMGNPNEPSLYLDNMMSMLGGQLTSADFTGQLSTYRLDELWQAGAFPQV
ncbi:hypothetical protein HDV63DRAFT_384216 [Trichoderma sp. SZMC 28014]